MKMSNANAIRAMVIPSRVILQGAVSCEEEQRRLLRTPSTPQHCRRDHAGGQ